VLTAPFDGIVTTLSFEVGQVVGDGQPVLSLAQPGELEVQADIPETLAAGLAGWQASASVPGIAQTLSLELRELSPVAAHPSRTYRARFSLSVRPPHLDLRIGMTADLELQQAGHLPGAVLPVSAILAVPVLLAATRSAREADAAVWVVDTASGALELRPVQLVSQSTDRVRVSGLQDGLLVVTVGAQKLDPGMRVHPVQRPLAYWDDAR
jgi:RND family efflux transporter MFP subunit